ncbi:4Fe-4S binding protein [Butyrivibrio sp. MC2013]|uniref:4Fe-4S binding protein n=1 Tax=Butyrivibrio sp. MC2013 TaxID=1280686 RepID=UPI00041F9A62|nr:4Fe-4S binding protein [Butyrivibrio sp. MC2013]
MTYSDVNEICRIFEIPEVAEDLLDFFFTHKEQELILNYGGKTFTAKDMGPDRAAKEYHRGLISKVDESGKLYRLNTFYYFLDVFAVSRSDKYSKLSRDKRMKLDEWYFNAYVDTLDPKTPQPTADKVLPLDEMLERIDSDDRDIYLNYCDCRTLTGECGLPTRTCITYKNGINSFVDRGLSEKIDKERAKNIVIEADKAGLMHTAAMGGICNCCGDCCYLFRSQKRLGTTGHWPLSDYVVFFDKDKCVSCGLCTRRCHFSVFHMDNKRIKLDPASCVGCGLCVNTCPKGALSLLSRKEDFYEL